MKKMIIMNHTHWDREWYESFESFRFKLREGINKVIEKLDNGEIEYFFLDGQTVVLEDYREIASEVEYQKLLHYIKIKKIEVGPWYLLSDEFLVSGESLIKNLEYGMKIAYEVGSPHNIGYLPDTFGHISQMPQILSGFGIENALIWRGADTFSYENMWKSPNGSSVKTIVLPLFEGYYQTYLNATDYVEKTDEFIAKHQGRVRNGTVLLMNGADHSFILENITDKISHLKQHHTELEIIEGNMSSFISELEKSPITDTITGEQRENGKIFVLPNVLSTRMYLKVLNQRAEDMANHYLDTLSIFMNDSEENSHFREYVWKTILKNHPHDSICGCSIDIVHEEMEKRSQKVFSAVKQYTKNARQNLFPYIYSEVLPENNYLYFINVLPFKMQQLVEFKIVVPQNLDTGAINILDDQNNQVTFDMIERTEDEVFLRQIFNEPRYHEAVVYKIAMLIDFKGIETKRFRYEIVEDIKKPEDQAQLYDMNEYFTVEYSKKGMIIIDKATQKRYPHINEFKASLDAGDTYNYSPPLEDVIKYATITNVRSGYEGKLFKELIITYSLATPKGLDETRTKQSSDRVLSEIVSHVRFVKNSRNIQFKTTIKNQASDQKLCVLFGVEKADTSYADTAFDIIERTTLSEGEVYASKNKEVKVQQHPTQSTILAHDIQFMHRGLQEYQIFRAEQDYLQVTLLRSVGWLSRRDLQTRGNGAGPGFPTPGAQCLGTYTVEYSIILGAEKIELNEAKKWRNLPLDQQSSVPVETENIYYQRTEHAIFSSAKMMSKNILALRYFNPTASPVVEQLVFTKKVKRITSVNLKGEWLEELLSAQEVEVAIEPFKIQTLYVYLENSEK